jgi:hypothetical protein
MCKEHGKPPGTCGTCLTKGQRGHLSICSSSSWDKQGWCHVCRQNKPKDIDAGVENSDLLKCPFCGSDAELIWDSNMLPNGGIDDLFYISCCRRECGCRTLSWYPASSAMVSWNKRATTGGQVIRNKEQTKRMPFPYPPEPNL